MNHVASPAMPTASGCFAARTTRRTPSAPMPVRRSQSLRTRAGVRSRAPSGSGRMTKSLPVPWPLAKRMALLCREDARCGPGEVGIGTVQPVDPWVPPEPGALPPHEPPRRLYRVRPRLLLGALAGQVPQDLLVAERATGGAAVAETAFMQGAHLVDEAEFPHQRDPAGDPLVQRGRVEVDAELDGRVVRHRVGEGRGEAAGQLDHFKGADDPP